MIEPHATAQPGTATAPAQPGTATAKAPPPGSGQGPARLPVSTATGRFLVLAGVFICAACGLVYELELVALASYLIGDSVTQASVVLSVMVFAMGLGSLVAKRLRRHAAAGFGAVEALLALVGGSSAMALYAVFAWTGDWGGAWEGGSSYLLVGFSLAIGLLIGAEVPLLMELIQRIRRQDAGGAVADLFAADYVGALVGGLAFPFLLLPLLGQLTATLVTGTVNAIAGGALVLGLFRQDLSGVPAGCWSSPTSACSRCSPRRPSSWTTSNGPRVTPCTARTYAWRCTPTSRRSSSPAARTAVPSTSTSTDACGSAAATNTATTRPSSTPR